MANSRLESGQVPLGRWCSAPVGIRWLFLFGCGMALGVLSSWSIQTPADSEPPVQQQTIPGQPVPPRMGHFYIKPIDPGLATANVQHDSTAHPSRQWNSQAIQHRLPEQSALPIPSKAQVSDQAPAASANGGHLPHRQLKATTGVAEAYVAEGRRSQVDPSAPLSSIPVNFPHEPPGMTQWAASAANARPVAAPSVSQGQQATSPQGRLPSLPGDGGAEVQQQTGPPANEEPRYPVHLRSADGPLTAGNPALGFRAPGHLGYPRTASHEEAPGPHSGRTVRPAAAILPPNGARDARPIPIQNHVPEKPLPLKLYPDEMIVFTRREPGFPADKRSCRITNVCKSESGKIILPTWLSQHKAEVKACGLKDVDFALVDQHFAPGSFTPTDGSNYQLTLSPVPNLGDLLGSERPRHHMPHFATDVLPSIHALDVVNGHFRPSSLISACRTPSQPCVDLPPVMPVIAVGYKILSMEPTSWIPRFLGLMGENSVGASILGDENSPDGSKPGLGERGMCFRSIVTTSASTGDLKVGRTFTPSSPFFKKNEISRLTKREGLKAGSPCIVNVVIQNRNSTRKINRVAQLVEAISIETKRRSMPVNVDVVDFDGMSFENQLSVSQTADIMIAAHGAGNTNFVFMRPDSAVLEVFPFAYSAGPFDSVARAVDVHYETLTAFPSTKQFHSCLLGYKTEPQLISELMGRWQVASQEFIARGSQDSLHLESGDEHRHGRMCARNQDLDVDIGRIIQFIVSQVPGQCPGGPVISHK